MASGSLSIGPDGLTVARILTDAREQAGISVRKLATLTGITNTRLHTLMSGQRPMTVDELTAICTALALRASDVLKATDAHAPTPTARPPLARKGDGEHVLNLLADLLPPERVDTFAAYLTSGRGEDVAVFAPAEVVRNGGTLPAVVVEMLREYAALTHPVWAYHAGVAREVLAEVEKQIKGERG